jgi:GNAT superfamily N-acetyltransferase
MRFQDALTTVYQDNPCAVLPNALWKTVNVLNQYQTAVDIKDGIIYLKAWNTDTLLVYWTKDRTIDLPPPYIDHVSLMVLHQDYCKKIPLHHFHCRQYFRMELNTLTPYSLPPTFCIMPVDVIAEIKTVSTVINRCYNTYISPETVKTWINHPVFDENLWIWIYDKTSKTPAALGIAERDKTVKEASLEWIQVLPEYRQKGLGKALVGELLKRVYKKANIITVSGETGYARQFYKSCGFTGEDTWYILTR